MPVSSRSPLQREAPAKVAELRQRRAELLDDLEAVGPKPQDTDIDVEVLRA